MNRTVSVDVKIKSVTVNKVDEKMEVIAIWKRGERSIDTQRKGKLGPGKINTRFGDQFKMKANLPYDTHSGKFSDKEGTITLYKSGQLKKPLGVADFNLAEYANHGQKRVGVKLAMHDCPFDEHAYFEIDVHIMQLDKSSQRPKSKTGSSKNNKLQMPQKSRAELISDILS